MKKRIAIAGMLIIMVLAVPFLAGCNSNSNNIFDPGEHGVLVETISPTPHVKANEGYRFLGWGEPIRESGNNIFYAQYEKREYFLDGDLSLGYFEFAQGVFASDIRVRRKTTNLQTNEYIIDAGFGHLINVVDPSGIIGVGGTQFGASSEREFDVTISIEIADTAFFSQPVVIENIRFIKNRIPVESITLSAWQDFMDPPVQAENTVRAGARRIIQVHWEPSNSSFPECRFEIVELIRGGTTSVTGEAVDEFASFSQNDDVFTYIQTTEQIEVGDTIRVRAINNRDPDVVSQILSITVV